ncbi:MAG: acetyltransferase [Acidobacteria bacterium]|nr:acetyltransferase [Acidobacteriota bacterium]MBI3423853.1 acetyltransferase [Acidobacteriota bacterium]
MLNKHISHHRWLVLLLLAAATQAASHAYSTVGQAAGLSFIDPTANLNYRQNISLGEHVYVGPFATLRTGSFGGNRYITIGNDSNVQDNTLLDASLGSVTLGDEAIVAHGGTVRGVSDPVSPFGSRRSFPASLGVGGKCPENAKHCPSFVSFNAVVEGATVQMDAMVGALARVGPGVIIPSGLKVLPGKNIATNADVNLTNGKLAPVTEADREFMHGVVEVNLAFAEQYAKMQSSDPDTLTGINLDPGHSDFNPDPNLPTLAGTVTRNASFRNRIIGDVRLKNTAAELNSVMGQRISLRADEGEPFKVGSIALMEDGVTFHALEHTHLDLGDKGSYGFRSIVHGGPTEFEDYTITGANFVLGARSLFFRSRIGANSQVGQRSVVQQCDFPANTIIGDRKIMLENKEFGVVEW